jgi:hypothetical protein
MRPPSFVAGLTLLVIAQVIPSYANQLSIGTFNSPLLFSGAQWQVKSAIGPVYLARKDAGAWKVLAVFDGTNGNYHLDWETPALGEYTAMDGAGTRSESITICDEATRSSMASSTRTFTRPSSPVHVPSTFYRRVIAMAAHPTRSIR